MSRCGAAPRTAPPPRPARLALSPTIEKLGLGQIAQAAAGFDGTPVARSLAEGDSLAAGFNVRDTPGHSPGHVSFWREADRTLICGDVFFGMNMLTTLPGLHQPFALATPDPAENRNSERRLAALAPDTVGFGHGPVLNEDAAGKLRDFVQALPA